MQINEMNLEEVEARLAEITSEVETRSGEELEKLELEVVELQTRKAELVDLETRTAQAEALNNEEVKPDAIIETRSEIIPQEEKKMFGTDSKEYRDAFYAAIAGNETAEQRDILATPLSVDGNGTSDGTALAIPKTLDEKIWDNIHSAHPILEDITTIASGIVMEVTKHTAIATRVSGKKDAATTAGAEENTFVKVTLAGVDYEKYVELTYAQAKMSQGALEDYLAQEIAAELGEALAKDVFTKIVSDAGTGRAVTKSDWFANIAEALGKADRAQNPVVYASVADYYAILGAVDTNGQPIFRDGLVLSAMLKKDNAVPSGKVVVVDPKMFVLNEIQGVMIESDKDVKAHRVIVSGYLRAEGCMRDNGAAAYIA